MRRGLILRMAVASGLLAVLIGAAFAFILYAVTQLRDSSRLARETRQELVVTEGLEKHVIDLETGVRGFVITREERFLDPFTRARAALPSRLAAAERAASGSEQRRRIERIARGVSSYIADYAAPLVRAVRRGDPAANSVATTAEGKRRIDALRADFARFRAAERGLLNERQDRADAASRRAIAAAAGALAASVLLVLLFTAYLTRAIVRPVRRAALMSQRLAEGDLSTRLPVGGVGEIGSLERSFNAMAVALETNREDLTRLLDEQAALRRVATLVARGLAPTAIFAAVADEARGLLAAENAVVTRYEADGTIVVVVASGEDVGEMPPGTRSPANEESVSAIVWRTRLPARVDVEPDDRPTPIKGGLRGRGVRSAVASPITVEGRMWGALVVATKRERLPRDAEERLAKFTDLAGTAISNADSRAELAASRARIVAAADDARRRIERDLHDGAQQRLVSLGLELRLLQLSVPPELADTAAEMGRLADELDAVVDELRELARGIHPAILSEGGLRPALRTLARRAAIPVELDVRGEERFPPPVEVAAYYVISEALTNAVKHAGASVARVAVERRDGVLELSVQDDGVGGADPSGGSGLVGLRDRVEALGGSIQVTSPRGAGTAIVVELPLEPVP